MDIFEKIARAICEADCGCVTENELARCRGLAFAALNSIREPTDTMKVAGGLKMEAIMFEGDPQANGLIFHDIGLVFSTMIDAEIAGWAP